LDIIQESNFHCVALTETWLSAEEENNLAVISSFLPDGYKILQMPRLTTKGGGVGFVFKEQYQSRLDTTFKFTSFHTGQETKGMVTRKLEEW
jgi:hypothetical protein